MSIDFSLAISYLRQLLCILKQQICLYRHIYSLFLEKSQEFYFMRRIAYMKFAKTFLADQLRRALFEKRLTQKDLAKKINVDGPMVSRWVTGDKVPTIKSIEKIAKALNLPINYFIKDTDSPSKNNNDKKDYARMDLFEEKLKRHEIEIKYLKEEIKRFKQK